MESMSRYGYTAWRTSRRRPHRPDDWATLLDRTDVLIVETRNTGGGGRAEVIAVTALDTTGAIRFAALSLPAGRIQVGAAAAHGLTCDVLRGAGALPWAELHDDLARLLEGASAVLAWDSAHDRRMLEQTARRHGLTLPTICWRDLSVDYERLLYAGGSLATVAERHGVCDADLPRAGTDCRRMLAILRKLSQTRRVSS